MVVFSREKKKNKRNLQLAWGRRVRNHKKSGVVRQGGVTISGEEEEEVMGMRGKDREEERKDQFEQAERETFIAGEEKRKPETH